jgi:enoyl-CoA hydratase
MAARRGCAHRINGGREERMSFDTLAVDTRGRIGWITINRPDKLNALNNTVLDDLDRAMDRLTVDDDVSVVVITGAGAKAFVAGADISGFRGLSVAQGRELARRGQQLFSRIESSRKPVIAAVNGFALGGGCELAMACHLRIAVSGARFGQPEVKLGLIPGYGGTQRLARLVGRGRALELLLSGGMIDAETARAWGLVNRVVEPAELQVAVQSLAEEILAVSPFAVARCLEAVGEGLDLPLEKALELEADLFGACFASEDMKEGVGAFLDKRPPSFTGR